MKHALMSTIVTPVTRRPRFMVARVALGIGLIAWLGLSGAIDWSRLSGLASAWRLTAAALLLLFLVVLLSSWRLCLLLSAQGMRLPLGASLRLSLIGALFSNFLPGSSGGDLVRIYFAARPNGGRRTEIATTVLIDRAIGLLALLLAPLLIAALGRSAVPAGAPVQGLLGAAGAGSVMLIAVFAIGGHRHNVLQRFALAVLGRSRLGRYAQIVFASLASMRRNERTILATIALSLFGQAMVITAIQVILLANGAASVNLGAALLTPFGMLANALPLTPGGLGVGEAAFESLFQFTGTASGAEALLSWRILTTLIDICGGVILVAGRTDSRMTYTPSAHSPEAMHRPLHRSRRGSAGP